MKALSKSIFTLLFIGGWFAGFANEQSQTSNVARQQQDFVKVKDGHLYYNETGQGIPIIVVHGGPGLDHRYLQPQLSQLAANHKLIFYDQRGSGRSLETPLDEKHINMHQFVEDLEDLRKSLGLNKFVLMGHSWGGWLAMQYAVDHQDHLIGLILLNSAPADYKGQKAFIDEFTTRTKNIHNDIKSLFAYEDFKKLNAIQISDLYRKLFSIYIYNSKNVKDLSLNFNIASAQSGFKVMEEMTKTSWLHPNIDLFPSLKKLSVPTFILHGKQDIVPVWTALEIKDAIPQSEIVVLDDCDHFSYIEQPSQFFTELNSFLDKIQGVDMQYTVEHQKKKFFIGLELRTNNEECSSTMPAHKAKFFGENIPSKIPNKINGNILALYTNYEGDYTKPYSWILGYEVSSLEEIPEGLVGKVIPESNYAVFTTQGGFPEGLIASWQAIWKSNLHRSYTSDFEVYRSDFDPQNNPQVKVYIAIDR